MASDDRGVDERGADDRGADDRGADDKVVDVPERSRYEIVRNGTVLGYSAYQKANNLIVFTHTEIDPQFEGQGVGGRLVRAALDDVRPQGIPVLPICPFVQQWMARHPDYADLDYRRRSH